MSVPRPRNRKEALRALHPSLKSRDGRSLRAFGDVRSVEVASSLAGEVHGSWASLLVSLEGFIMPVQSVTEVDWRDVFWYMEVLMGLLPVGSVSESVPAGVGNIGTTARYMLHNKRTPGRVSSDHEGSWAADSVGCWWSGLDELAAFPVKKDTPLQKINLWFKDVWHDVVSHFPEVAVLFGQCDLTRGLRNDEACAWLIWMVSAHHVYHASVRDIFVALVGRREVMKELTTIIKGLGLQCEESWALLVELDTMFGRGVFIPEPWEDVKGRVVRRIFMTEKATHVDEDALRSALRAILRDELASPPEWGDKDRYWSRRWLFTKAGAHSGYAEQHWRSTRLDLPERPSRREFSEAQEENVVALGSPRVDAGLSWKLEHGKTRAIYSCDSRSYFTFDYLLKPVEKVWRNGRVLLDPGREPQVLFYRRLAKEGPCRFMLDFDDFNSQHTLLSMKICIEEACRGAPKEVLDWALRSWDNMHVHWVEGSKLRSEKMCGTLPSGHRATTFVNTLLNAAYCRIVSGEIFDRVMSHHTGDDVIFSGSSEDCSEIAKRFASSRFRANKMKQSIGHRSGEFLRICYSADGARGYAARAISSLVSGNWVTESRPSPRSYTENLIRGFWNVAARSGERSVGKCGITSLSRWVPQLRGQAYRLLTHDLSFDGTPIVAARSQVMFEVLRCEGGTSRPERAKKKYSFATDAFLRHHMDFKLLEEAEISVGEVRAAMLTASYKPRGFGEPSPLRLATTPAVGLVLHDQPATFGHLARVGKGEVEALKLLRTMYDTIDWRFIVAKVRGGDQSSISTEGKMEWPVASAYSMPFSDCMRARSILTRPGIFINEYPVRV